MSILNNASDNIVDTDILEINKPYPILCATHVMWDSGSTFLIAIQKEHNHIVKIYLPEIRDRVYEDLMTINGGVRKYEGSFFLTSDHASKEVRNTREPDLRVAWLRSSPTTTSAVVGSNASVVAEVRAREHGHNDRCSRQMWVTKCNPFSASRT